MARDDGTYVDSELLISEVERRPLLYDTSIVEYSDRNLKAKGWEEVYRRLVANWAELSPAGRNNRGRDIQKRWRSIRDSFIKDFRKQKKSKKGRRYVFYNQLLFLVPTIEKRRTTWKVGPESQIVHLDDDEERISDHTDEPLVTKPLPRKRQWGEAFELDLQGIPTLHQQDVHVQQSAQQEELLIPSLYQQQERTYSHEDDDDKLFLLSLLPSFKKMDEDANLATRIEIMQVVRRALQSQTIIPAFTTASFPTQLRQSSHQHHHPLPASVLEQDIVESITD